MRYRFAVTDADGHNFETDAWLTRFHLQGNTSHTGLEGVNVTILEDIAFRKHDQRFAIAEEFDAMTDTANAGMPGINGKSSHAPDEPALHPFDFILCYHNPQERRRAL